MFCYNCIVQNQFLFSFFLLIVLSGCKTVSSDRPTSKSIIGSWELLRTKDSYTGNWTHSVGEIQFVFESSGRFKRIQDDSTPCEGTYKLLESYYEIKHSCNTSKLNYQLEDLSGDTLKLSLLGRHGKVFYDFYKL